MPPCGCQRAENGSGRQGIPKPLLYSRLVARRLPGHQRGFGALGDQLLDGVALAVVVAAATSLMQAYGVHLDVFATTGAPGGTLGNRNFVAHICAFGIPVLLLAGIRARRYSGYLLACIGVAIVTAALVLTRSRAGWLATAVGLLVFFVFGRMHVRLVGTIAGVVIGAAAALLLPNTLRELAFSRDATLISVLAAAVVAGLFDAVLLLAAPAMLVFAAVGALTPSGIRDSGWRVRAVRGDFRAWGGAKRGAADGNGNLRCAR